MPNQHTTTTTDEQILEAMRRAGREVRAADLARQIHMKASSLNKRLAALRRLGKVARRPQPRSRAGLWQWTRTTAAILADHPPE